MKVMQTDWDKQVSTQLYNKVENERKKRNYPSLQVSIQIKDKFFHCITGLSKRKLRSRATLDSLYYLGSVSKIFVKGVILKLIQDGKMTLDDSIRSYVDLPPFANDVLIKHLLHHSSGLFDPLDTDLAFPDLIQGKKWTMQEVIQSVRTSTPLFEPGSERSYSNSGYVLLGKAAEVVGKCPFSQLLNELILEPLHLTHTHCPFENDSMPARRLSAGYDSHFYCIEGNGKIVSLSKYPISLSGSGLMSGSIVSNSSDLCVFMHNLFEGSLFDDKTKRLSRLFFGTKNLNGVVFREQVGYLPGYKSFVGHSSDHNLSIAALANISDRNLLDDAVGNIVEELLHLELIQGHSCAV
ncbi:serine hydrolase domain-containing protein [Cohnella lubricantis]|uniref:Beta-lactamase family protein n=1 Tax=Cohnella lubricantis TaxID=2163172 RepID=A0A841TCQ2_9BACL|nr:serine hydrolase domain-containing protein [Cohnella lubricantis]MBB6678792.1 beta-lactamase family protein [Cohnella lubricantis]MBP2117875.1 D-alanyl-D-alanine carboxypeptidase [Cohnella lubricantis]